MQDAGTAIYELYKEAVTRYSVIEKKDFEVLKINFYNELTAGFSLVISHFKQTGINIDYVNAFLSISLEKPEDYATDFAEKNRYDRKVAAYLCCLYKAGFSVPTGLTVKFQGEKSINELVREGNPIDPTKGIPLEDATNWFTRVWKFHNDWPYLKDYATKNGKGGLYRFLNLCCVA